ncbi:MAG: purine-nucleoside phosphorylase [Crocinitomicaceae bacterium]|mgnify:FL=1|jgi:purine-nucleoside phosphorylase|nr:purine-nucleoside phosphorylase [Crocinitomicaceae bacterium]MBT5403127.1 purine-nucleoside phosphorylase [Crocinitomicaceae bacterium]MBT6029955.1 purine-nucleoside phosphorylase [Crocinitomicaceae bacterium]MBT6513611.1 purine-nucleoside phosphorylase [Crocinitomicaceae bacterium]
MKNELNESVAFLKQKGMLNPEIGIILGTGLGKLVKNIEVEVVLPYSEIAGFGAATVEFHEGQLIYGKIEGTQVVVMQGRYHFYEGYSMQQIVFPVRVMKLLGVSKLFVSNAAGCMNLNWSKGDLMLIKDHINTFPSHPLRGPNLDNLGSRFPDMSGTYSNELRTLLKIIAEKRNIVLREGVYVSAQGPMLETPAEYRYLKSIGGDAVGMSTIPEVIAAIHSGIEVVAISVLTDECDPDNLKVVNIEEIIEIAGRSEIKLIELIIELIKNLKNE